MADLARERAEAIRSGQIEDPEKLVRLVRSETGNRRIYLDAFLDHVETLVYEEKVSAASVWGEWAPDLATSAAPGDKDRRVRAWVLAGAAKLLAGDLEMAQERLVDHALKHLTPGSLESPSVWATLAVVKAEQGLFRSARALTAKALEFLRECDQRGIRSCDRYSMAAVLLQNGLVKRRAGRAAREVAREFLQALFLSTPSTPRVRDAAARQLALHCGATWLEGEARLAPGPLLESVKRIRRMLEIEGRTFHSRCYARLHWVEAMALCALAQGLTRIAFNKFVTAKGYLMKVDGTRDLIAVNLDLGYWLLREQSWQDLGVVVDELLELAVADDRSRLEVESLRLWKLGLEEGFADRELTAAVYRRLRGVRRLGLYEPDGAEPEEDARAGKWFSPYGW